MFATVTELVLHLQQVLPQPKSIIDVKPDERGGLVKFSWNGKSFVVKKTLEAFEIKGDKLFVTGASILMQAALMKKNKSEKVIQSIVAALLQAEDMILGKQQTENGLKLIQAVKITLTRLVGKTV